MEDIKNKLTDENVEQVSGGGGAIHNKGNIWCPDINGSDVNNSDGAYYNVKVGENFPDAVAPNCSHDINISGDAAY